MAKLKAASLKKGGLEELEPCLAVDFPVLDYPAAWQLQTRLVEMRHLGRLGHDVLLTLEHPPVMTVGRRGLDNDLLVPESTLAEQGISLHRIERGGLITYHGPGQLIIYPIFDLRACGLRLTEFVQGLEEIMLRIAADFGVRAQREESNRGVFAQGRKLGSLGVAVRRGVTFHGLALNVNVDLAPFQLITPCGLAGIHMTSLALESEVEVDMAEVRRSALDHLSRVFHRECRCVSAKQLIDFAELELESDDISSPSPWQAPLA